MRRDDGGAIRRLPLARFVEREASAVRPMKCDHLWAGECRTITWPGRFPECARIRRTCKKSRVVAPRSLGLGAGWEFQDRIVGLSPPRHEFGADLRRKALLNAAAGRVCVRTCLDATHRIPPVGQSFNGTGVCIKASLQVSGYTRRDSGLPPRSAPHDPTGRMARRARPGSSQGCRRRRTRDTAARRR